jgi:tetratricopeptide (TPR) repeat protein
MNPLILALSAAVDNLGDISDIKRALEKSKKALELEPGHYQASGIFAYSSYLLGDYKTSIETEIKLLHVLDDEAREEILAVFQDEGYIEAQKTMLIYLEEYAKTNYYPPVSIAQTYARVGNLDKAIEWYIKGYEMQDPTLPSFTTHRCFNDIKDDPRIISIVEEMNLPLLED